MTLRGHLCLLSWPVYSTPRTGSGLAWFHNRSRDAPQGTAPGTRHCAGQTQHQTTPGPEMPLPPALGTRTPCRSDPVTAELDTTVHRQDPRLSPALWTCHWTNMVVQKQRWHKPSPCRGPESDRPSPAQTRSDRPSSTDLSLTQTQPFKPIPGQVPVR